MRAQRRTLILSVLIVASCGLGYELISSTLSSYLLGDSVLQFSSVIGWKTMRSMSVACALSAAPCGPISVLKASSTANRR